MGAAGDADKLSATKMEKPLGSQALFAGRERCGRVKQLQNYRQFFLIEFDDAGAPDGIGKDFPRIEGVAQINVENACGSGTDDSQEFVDGEPGGGGTLC